MKWSLLVGISAVSVFALTACTTPAVHPEPEPTPEAGLIAITVGVTPIIDIAPLRLGIEQGFFQEAGLDVTIESGAGGAALIPGVVSGDFDFAFASYLSGMVARQQGRDIVYVASGTSTTGSTSLDFSGVVVKGDSRLLTPDDIEDERVSVNPLAGIGEITIRQAVEKYGGDPLDIDFVEMSFPDALEALQNERVDAAWLPEPFLTAAVDAGARVISYTFADFDEALDVAGYFTARDQIEAEPEKVAAFQAAMTRSLEYAQQNPAEVRQIVARYTQIRPAILERVTLPRFATAFNRASIAKLGAAAARFGALSAQPDLDGLLLGG